jgi:hypothetical protein
MVEPKDGKIWVVSPPEGIEQGAAFIFAVAVVLADILPDEPDH